MLTINLRYLRFWLIMVLKLILLMMWEIDDWDWMKKWEMLEFWDGWFLSNHLSYQHPSFFLFSKYLKMNYFPSHLLSSIVRFDFIFSLETLLSYLHHLTIKLRMQRCWWKLELIHSWEIIRSDLFPVLHFLSFPFHVCRAKQQEIWQEKRIILILKDYWRIMREILKDWNVWDEFDDKIS